MVLEIYEKTINGQSEKLREYSMPKIYVPVSFGSVATGEDYTQSNSITIKPFKTLSKPTHALFYVSPDAEETSSGGSAAIYTFEGKSFSIFSNDNYEGYNYGNVLVSLNTDSNTTINVASLAEEGADSASGYYESTIAFNDPTFYDKSNSTITIKKSVDEALADPTTGFSAWGTELNATEYTNISSVNNTYVSVEGSAGDTNTDIILKIEDINTNVKALFPIADTKVYTNSGDNSSNVTSTIYVWNYTTSTWDNFGGTSYILEVDGFNATGPGSNIERGNKLMSYSGTEDWSNGKISDYVDSGAMYIRIRAASKDVDDYGILYVNYTGVMAINGLIWD